MCTTQTDRMLRLIRLNLIILADFIPMTYYGFVKFYGRQVSPLIDSQLQKLRLIYPLKSKEMCANRLISDSFAECNAKCIDAFCIT